MKNEGGSTFELPSQPETPEQLGEQIEEKVIEQQRPATQEAGVGKRAPKPGSTAVTDVPALPRMPAVPAAPPVDKAAPTAPLSPTTADLRADDADLIEKEWVQRAKSVVAHTQENPHRQKSEMSKVKADYIQKRFKKIIKTDEATT